MRPIDADALKKEFPKDTDWEYPTNTNEYVCEKIDAQPTVQPETNCSEIPNNSDAISRQAAIEPEAISKWKKEFREYVDSLDIARDDWKGIIEYIEELPSAQPDASKYEYHYDHTDCIWYRPEARNRCPVTCAQYRDGWNDAMNYIFRDGKGYRPYRRGEQYEE